MNSLKVIASGSKANCYLLSLENEILILECGVNYKEIIKNLDYELSKVIGCLVTHEHKDHSKSIKELTENGIDVYSSLGTFEAVGIQNHRTRVIKARNPIKIGNFTILPFEANHDAAEPLGFLINHKAIGNMLFLTDSYYCEYKFENLNHILVECNYKKSLLDENIENKIIPLSLRNRITKSHFELENVIEFLKANDLSKIKNIMILHISGQNGDGEIFKSEIEKNIGFPVEIARKGMDLLL